jgi:hypothetical protein
MAIQKAWEALLQVLIICVVVVHRSHVQSVIPCIEVPSLLPLITIHVAKASGQPLPLQQPRRLVLPKPSLLAAFDV